MMYKELHEYLILQHELPLPGLGVFQVKRHPAIIDFPSKQIEGPGYSIQWQDGMIASSDGLCNWLAGNFNISHQDAKSRLEKFIFQLKTHIASGDIIHWKGIGDLGKGAGVLLKYSADEIVREGLVPANKVIREKAEHMVKVGEDERTSEQMTALLSVKKRTGFIGWRIAAAITGIISVGFIVWYLSQHGWDLSAGNQQAIELNSAKEATYRIYP